MTFQRLFEWGGAWGPDTYQGELSGPGDFLLVPKWSDRSSPTPTDNPCGWHVPHRRENAEIAHIFAGKENWIDLEPYAGFWDEAPVSDMAPYVVDFANQSGDSVNLILDPRRIIDGTYPPFDPGYVRFIALMNYWNDFGLTPSDAINMHSQCNYLTPGIPVVSILPTTAPIVEVAGVATVLLARESQGVGYWRYNQQMHVHPEPWQRLTSLIARV